ncbi:hypothetical protein HYPSUDRAFT_52222 [Hypholoma sublateritium FD-334 SS-4]|uniref:Uncharacterized protein n=1 Tax=Hypholoma sublateritium (strain FD-334 SS-4) TaxID=945553 RepID=A0A0D2P713_HYPSF|nr:hypothetical protein HYPSUDRAFT_52222 [Hypholoma sublateritium FD-334 SS-4]
MQPLNILADDAAPIRTIAADVDFAAILRAVLPSLPLAESSGTSAPPCVAGSRPTKRARPFRDGSPDARDLLLEVTDPPKQLRQSKKRRRVRGEKIVRDGCRASSAIAQKHLSNVRPIQTRIETAGLPTAHGDYTALNKPLSPKIDQASSVQELQALGFQYIAAGTIKKGDRNLLRTDPRSKSRGPPLFSSHAARPELATCLASASNAAVADMAMCSGSGCDCHNAVFFDRKPSAGYWRQLTADHRQQFEAKIAQVLQSGLKKGARLRFGIEPVIFAVY